MILMSKINTLYQHVRTSPSIRKPIRKPPPAHSIFKASEKFDTNKIILADCNLPAYMRILTDHTLPQPRIFSINGLAQLFQGEDNAQLPKG